MTTMSLNPLQDEPQSSISSTPPPWPKIPSSSRLTTEHRPLLGFEEYIGPGLRYHTSESSKGHHHQIFPQRLHMQCVTVNKSGVTGGKQQAPTSYTVNRAGLTVIRSVDAWAIGDETVEWVEPPGTKIFKHESDVGPFQRLMGAVDGFYQSRQAAFEYKRYKLMFDIIRNHLNLRTDKHSQHWAASPKISTAGETGEREDCVLLRRPVTAVRGLLALARREAESGWDADPAIALADILSAFLSYVRYHGTLNDVPGFEDAVVVARTASRKLQYAKALEDVVCNPRGWNAAAWKIWGGEYGTREREGSEYEPSEETAVVDSPPDDGGWGVGQHEGGGHQAIYRPEAQLVVKELIAPEVVDHYARCEYIPFARRRVARILSAPSQTGGGLWRDFWQLITVPAPWTPEERWKGPKAWTENDQNKDLSLGETGTARVFDVEVSSFETDPEEIVILVEPFGIPPDVLVGTALRGRWALIKHKTGSQDFWIHEAKDYVLPSFWSAEEAFN